MTSEEGIATVGSQRGHGLIAAEGQGKLGDGKLARAMEWSRSDPPLPLARLRARGQLTEMRVADLRFTPAEAGNLLQYAAPALPDASVAALAARTEGWAAGVEVAGGTLSVVSPAGGPTRVSAEILVRSR